MRSEHISFPPVDLEGGLARVRGKVPLGHLVIEPQVFLPGTLLGPAPCQCLVDDFLEGGFGGPVAFEAVMSDLVQQSGESPVFRLPGQLIRIG